jgi:hypothetical protein
LAEQALKEDLDGQRFATEATEAPFRLAPVVTAEKRSGTSATRPYESADFAAKPGAQITPELLSKQLLDVRLVIHRQNKKFHA